MYMNLEVNESLLLFFGHFCQRFPSVFHVVVEDGHQLVVTHQSFSASAFAQSSCVHIDLRQLESLTKPQKVNYINLC